MSPARPQRSATLADLLAIPEAERFHEIIDGELVRKAMPSPPHARGQARLGGRISDAYDRLPGRRRPGGWWILTEVDIELDAHQIYRPDIAGWRREHLPTLPTESPIGTRPDWVCEILSPTNSTNDTIKKHRNYHRYKIPHYWILDPMAQTLTVFRWAEDGYLAVILAERGERVHAEPFDAVELNISALFGDEAEESDESEP